MRPARIVLLLIALIAGGLAAYLATRGSAPETVVEQVAAPPPSKAKVLVAKQAIGVGERLTEAKVEWQPWPENDVRAEYITSANSPNATTQISGAVARHEIFPGEPILDSKLVRTDQGYLSAVLSPGMRGVSVQVSAASGSGGFIIPNDRVDVVLTQSIQGQSVSRVLLANVKVLAIGTRLGQTGTTGAPTDPQDPKSQIFTDAIATLELTPPQADTMINATALGKISLVLRSVADFGAPTTTVATEDAPKPAAPTSDDSQVRIVRFGRSQSVTPGSATQGSVAAAVVAPATQTVTMSTTPAAPTTSAPAAAAKPTATTGTSAPPGTTTTTITPVPPKVQQAPTIPVL